MKICVIIPVYNEAVALGAVIDELRKKHLDVLVIDDGSKDDSAAIAQRCGAAVIRNKKNLGKGACLIKGYRYAQEHQYEAVVTIDGDGQHLPSEIDGFLDCVRTTNADMIIGNRMRDTQNMPFIRQVTNTFMSLLISALARRNIPDTQCGFRLIKTSLLKAITLTTANFETESEIILKAAQKRARIESIPITTVYIGEQSKINPFIDTWRFLLLLIKGTWKKGT